MSFYFAMLLLRVVVGIFPIFLLRAELPGTLEILLSDLIRLGNDLVLQNSVSRVEFWFYKAFEAGPNLEELLERLIASEPYVTYPKVLLGESGSFDAAKGGNPMLVVVFFDENQHCGSEIFVHLQRINMKARLVVILSYVSPALTAHLLRCFVGHRLFNVLYVAVLNSNAFAYINCIVFREVIQEFTRYESIEQAFPRQDDLAGQTLAICTHSSEIWNTLDRKLAALVAEEMNGKVQFEVRQCQPGDSYAVCSSRKFNKSCVFSIGRWGVESVDHGSPVLPMYSYVALVRRGGLLRQYEIVFEPYSTNCWIALLFSFGLYAVLIQICWRTSMIDLMLITLCKLNSSSLNRMNSLEKLTTLGSILVTFVILSGYEAKFTSYLSNWPRRRTITTIDELQASNLSILVETHTAPNSLLEDIRFQRRFLQMNFTSIHATASTDIDNVAIVMEHKTAQLFLNLPNISSHYVMLAENLANSLSFYYFGERNSLLNRFMQLQRSIYEAGLDQLWNSLILAAISAKMESRFGPTSAMMITYEQLRHFKSIFIFLWMCGVGIFLMELGSSSIKQRLSSFRLRRRIGDVPRMRAQTYPFRSKSRAIRARRKSV